MKVDVEPDPATGTAFDASVPTKLLDFPGPPTSVDSRLFDPSFDGRGLIAAVRSSEWRPADRLRFVLNWTAELR